MARATSVPGIWALGECNGRGAFTHTAYNDYEIVAANLLDGGTRSDRVSVYALFTDPPLGRVGLNEGGGQGALKAAGRPAADDARQPRDREGRDANGFIKVLADADTRAILGAAIFGIEGDEAIHAVLDLMVADAPFDTMTRAVHIHPTVAELLPTVFAEMQPARRGGEEGWAAGGRERGGGSWGGRAGPAALR